MKVEVRVLQLTGAPDGLVGMKLMQEACSPDRPGKLA
jgi:hypothetical protein